jgi:hypothetical protein
MFQFNSKDPAGSTEPSDCSPDVSQRESGELQRGFAETQLISSLQESLQGNYPSLKVGLQKRMVHLHC